MAWDNRHHVGSAPKKPLPVPPKIKSLHGGPIKPKVDMSKPSSMTAPSSKHNRAHRPRSSHQKLDSELLQPVLQPDLKHDEHFRIGHKITPNKSKNSTHPDSGKRSHQSRVKKEIDANISNLDMGDLYDSLPVIETDDESMASRIANIEAELRTSDYKTVSSLAQRHAAANTLQRQQQHSQLYDVMEGTKDEEEEGEKLAEGSWVKSDQGSKDWKDEKSSNPPSTGQGLMLDIPPAKDKSSKMTKAEDIREEKEEGGTSFGLKLDIGSIKKEAAEKDKRFDHGGGGGGYVDTRASGAYEISASGTFVVDKFTIRKEGTVRHSSDIGGKGTSLVDKGEVGVGTALVYLGVLGHGASSMVHKALHVPTLRLVAVKKISVFDDAKRHQMVRELRALHHNKVALNSVEWGEKPLDMPSCSCMVSFFDAYTEINDGAISLVMEYMDGGSLQDIVDTGGCGDEGVLANISFRCLQGLNFLHSNHQIHRDIKPGNLLINHQGHVKVSDFGIVREVEDSAAVAETFVGTFTYMSPERIGGLPYSFNSDIWALGLSLLTCALGQFPYDTSGGYWGLLNEIKTKEPRGLKEANFSEAMTDFLLSCLERDPELRPSAEELLEHPFVCECSMTEVPPDEEYEDGGSATARLELDELIHALRSYYQKLWAQQSKSGVSPTIPNFHRKKVARLALQLGVSEMLARLRFASLVRSLKTDAERFWTDANM